MKVLFCTNLPSPYRVDFFNELGKYCDLTVCYERKSSSERDEKWVGSKAQTYTEVYLDLIPVGVDKSRGNALKDYVAGNSFDQLILTNYVSPATMKAIFYCKKKRIPYWIEYDGGLNKPDRMPKRLLKRSLLKSAAGHLTTCTEHIRYLEGLGIKPNRIYKYPFTSIHEEEIVDDAISAEQKEVLRKKLDITELKVIISVGRFNYLDGEGKGFDLLFKIAEQTDPDTGIYIIGDSPTERFIQWKQEKALGHVHFVPFKERKALFEYYYAADLLVLLTRGDVWGLVINEAMACGLPVITTDRCVAGIEMVQNGENGYIVPVNTYHDALEHIKEFYASDKKTLSECCIETAKEYTIEKMALRHMEIFKSL